MSAPAGALVTGAGRGLGRGIAELLADRGYTVAVTDVDEQTAVTAAAEIGRGAFAIALDVRDDARVRAVCAEVVERTGRLDVWVNNAGVLLTGPAWEHDAQARQLMMDVNATGTMNGTLAAIDAMRSDGGHIVNIVSLAGLIAVPGEAIYAATKHAALSFSLGVAADMRIHGVEGIDISCICPDGIWTPMLHDKLDDPGAALSFSGSLLEPQQVVDAVGHVLDHPRAVTAVPRWRGVQVRAFDAVPGIAQRMTPLMVKAGRLSQRRHQRKRG